MRALASPQIIHAALEAGFPRDQQQPGEQARKLLWRTDWLNGALYILAQSACRPDFTHVIEQFAWPATGQTWETREYAAFLDGLAEGQRWRFRLRANPVHSVGGRKEKGGRGEVKAHVTVEQQRQWLISKSDRLGLRIDNVDVVHRETIQFRRAAQRVTLSRATFEGVLTVAHAVNLSESIRSGIGRAKAYGCGLMTLAGI